jgi:hypothetical protein
MTWTRVSPYERQGFPRTRPFNLSKFKNKWREDLFNFRSSPQISAHFHLNISFSFFYQIIGRNPFFAKKAAKRIRLD